MIVRKPSRISHCFPLAFFLATAHLLAGASGFSPAQPNTRHTLRPDLQSSQATVIQQTATGSLAHASRPHRIRHFSPAIVPADVAAVTPDGWFLLSGTDVRGIARHIPVASGRSPPSFLF